MFPQFPPCWTENTEQRGTGIEKVPEIVKWNGQFSGGPVHPRKVVHLERWTSFFETFPVGPNRSFQFWTEISGHFGWMDRAHNVCFPLYPRLLSIMPNRPIRDQWEYPTKMERHFPIKPSQPIGTRWSGDVMKRPGQKILMPYPTTARGPRCCFRIWHGGRIRVIIYVKSSEIYLNDYHMNGESKSWSRTDEIRLHVKLENNTSGRARLWDTALKFLCPGLFITSPDHLEWPLAAFYSFSDFPN